MEAQRHKKTSPPSGSLWRFPRGGALTSGLLRAGHPHARRSPLRKPLCARTSSRAFAAHRGQYPWLALLPTFSGCLTRSQRPSFFFTRLQTQHCTCITNTFRACLSLPRRTTDGEHKPCQPRWRGCAEVELNPCRYIHLCDARHVYFWGRAGVLSLGVPAGFAGYLAVFPSAIAPNQVFS